MYAANGAGEAIAAWLTVRGPEPGPLFVPVDKAGRIVLRRLTAESVFDRLAYLAKRAGVQRFSPHDMRRSFISDLLDKRRGPRPGPGDGGAREPGDEGPVRPARRAGEAAGRGVADRSLRSPLTVPTNRRSPFCCRNHASGPSGRKVRIRRCRSLMHRRIQRLMWRTR